MTDALDDLTIRRPTEADHAVVVRLVDEWWGGRKVHGRLPRLWFRHFAGTSWIAERADGRPAGFLVGFVSPDRPDEAFIHLVGVDPNGRRRGLGRRLYRRFLDDVASRGARHAIALAEPGDPVAIGFHRRLGFRPLDGPGTQSIYGTPAVADYDYDREDRVVLVLDLPGNGPGGSGVG